MARLRLYGFQIPTSFASTALGNKTAAKKAIGASLVAVPVVLIYNYFLRRLKLTAADLDDFAHDFYSLAQKHAFRVQLQADNGVNYGEVARAMASLERAGITKLSVITEK